ncbi:BTAD domain-containing putative transcriptional regulator [Luteimicrobium sp. NPDC057192]|uniref:AfsR/SARP family transcriptional regulator n=1 Tax=Luteimicrobium sp. NPDC057192 TaxID=3346042 RepID=UPI00363A2F49
MPGSPPPSDAVDVTAAGPALTCDATVLGAVQARGADGALVAPGGVRSRELLVALVLAHGRPVSSRALLDDLWWDHDDLADPRAALQTLVSRTRRIVASGLVSSGPAGYAWSGTSDLGAAHGALDAATAALAADDPGAALEATRGALRLWRGEPGADLSAGSPLADTLAAEAARLASALQEVLLAALVAAGHDDEALDLAARRLAVRPTDEAACVAYMSAAARLGRVNDALRAFAALREALADELGADPGASVGELHERLLRGEVPRATVRRAPAPTSPDPSRPGVAEDDAPSSPSVASGVPRPSPALAIGLRAAPNALVGRDSDVLALEEALRRSRLVTVLGPGGLGKTRIAQELAHRAAGRGEPVAVIELASVRTDDDVELALATALGVRDVQGSQRIGDGLPRPDTRARILDRLRAPGTLVVLDNCEHVLDGTATWVAEALAETGVRVLTTSRAPLALAAETVRPLPPLASRGNGVGQADADPGPAVVLFEQRARAARPEAPLPRDVVERLCERLDGLPLAIELAAARVRSMSVVEIERRLASRFALLTSGDRAAPERHRTLRAVIEWSWNLLGTGEQALLRRASVFPGTFGAETVEAVTARVEGRPADPTALETLDDLDGLVGQSMLVVVEDGASGTTRYRMLETVREFGGLELVRAGEEPAVRDAVYAWATAFARDLGGRLAGHEQVATMRRTRAEQDILVQVVRWALEDRRRDVLGPVFALLAHFWLLRGQFVEAVSFGLDVADVFVGHEPTADDADDLAWVYFAAGSPLAVVLERERSIRSAARLRRLVRGPLPLKPGTRAFAELAVAVTDLAALPVLLERQRADDDWTVSMFAHIMSAQIAENMGELGEAEGYAHRAYDLAAQHEDLWGVAMATQSLAELAAEAGRPEDALRWIATTRSSTEGLGLDLEAFLFQTGSIEANALVALGRGAEARSALQALAQTPDEDGGSSLIPGAEEIYSASDRRITGLAGLSLDAYARGEVREALDLASTAVAELGRQRRQGLQGSVVQCANRLAMAVLDAEDARAAGRAAASTADEREDWALALTTPLRIVLRGRGPGGFVDRPVLGAAAIALGGFLWSERDGAPRELGLELAALAARVGSRQDYIVLDRARHRAAAVRALGEDAVEAAEARAAAAVEPAERIVEIVGERPWRRPTG